MEFFIICCWNCVNVNMFLKPEFLHIWFIGGSLLTKSIENVFMYQGQNIFQNTRRFQQKERQRYTNLFSKSLIGFFLVDWVNFIRNEFEGLMELRQTKKRYFSNGREKNNFILNFFFLFFCMEHLLNELVLSQFLALRQKKLHSVAWNWTTHFAEIEASFKFGSKLGFTGISKFMVLSRTFLTDGGFTCFLFVS